MSGMPWVKLHTNKLDDIRFRQIDHKAKGIWLDLVLLAGKLDQGGCFIQNGKSLNETEIAILINCKLVELSEGLKKLKAINLASKNGHGWQLTDFKDEQLEWDKGRFQTKERMRKSRANKKDVDKLRRGDASHILSDASHILSDASHILSDAPVTLQELDIDKELEEEKELEGSEEKTTTTTSSSSSWTAQLKKIKPPERKSASLLRRILGAAGLGDPKLSEVSVSMATRIIPEEVLCTTLSALASVYSDDKSDKSPVLVAYRLEHNTVSAAFSKPKTWKIIPQKVLEAAGIPDIDSYIRHEAAKAWTQ